MDNRDVGRKSENPQIPNSYSKQLPTLSPTEGELVGRKAKPKPSDGKEEESIDKLFEQTAEQKTQPVQKELKASKAETSSTNSAPNLPRELWGEIYELSSPFPKFGEVSKEFLKGFEFQISAWLAPIKKIIGDERVQLILKNLPPKADSKDELKALLLDQRQRAKDIYGGSELLEKLASEHKSLMSVSVVNEIEQWIQTKQDENLILLVHDLIASYAFLYPKFDELKNLDAESMRKWMEKNPSELNRIDIFSTSRNTKYSYLPAEIGLFTNLKYLTILQSDLRTLPPEIVKLEKLQNLAIFQSPHLSIPSYLADLPKLSGVNLSRNNFQTIPSVIFALSELKSLILNSNEIVVFPTDINKLEKLEWLDLSNNKIDYIPKELFIINSLQYINLSNNKIENFDTSNIPDGKIVELENNPLIKS